MKTCVTYKQVIDLWPTRQALADDLSHVTGEGVLVSRVNQWLVAGRIPRKHWQSVEEAAKHRGIESASLESLAEVEKQTNLRELDNG